MRLLIATPLYPPEPGGPSTYAKLLEEGLFDFDIAIADLVKFADVKRHPKFLRHVMYFWRVFKAAKQADLVLALDPVSVGFPSLLAALLRGKPLVVKVVGDYAWEQGTQRFGITDTLDEFVEKDFVSIPVSFLRAVQTTVAQGARAVIVPSEYLKRVVLSWGIPERKIHVIPNAMDNERIGTVPGTLAALSIPLVVSVGRLVPWKNMPGVIDAVAELRKDGLSVSLAIVGDGPERAHIEEYGKRAGAVLTGALSHADTLAVIDRADVFVLNSTYEGLSHLLIEALSLGVPTVATEVGGNPELVANNVNGLLVPPGNTPELAKAIRHLFDRAEAERLTKDAAAFAERFSKKTMLANTSAFLKSLV